jgi:hypothetical protein
MANVNDPGQGQQGQGQGDLGPPVAPAASPVGARSVAATAEDVAAAPGAPAAPQHGTAGMVPRAQDEEARRLAAAQPKGPLSADPSSPGFPSGPAGMPTGDPAGRPTAVGEPDRPTANRGSLAGAENPLDHPDMGVANEHFRAAIEKAHRPRGGAKLDPRAFWEEVGPDVDNGVKAMAAATRNEKLEAMGPALRVMQLMVGALDSVTIGEGEGEGEGKSP